MEKKEPLYTGGGNVKWYSALEHNLAVLKRNEQSYHMDQQFHSYV